MPTFPETSQSTGEKLINCTQRSKSFELSALLNV